MHNNKNMKENITNFSHDNFLFLLVCRKKLSFEAIFGSSWHYFLYIPVIKGKYTGENKTLLKIKREWLRDLNLSG